MLNELELDEDTVKDGLALYRIMDDERQWKSFTDLLSKLNADAISAWEGDDEGKYPKKWLRGYRQALSDVRARIEQRANDAATFVEAKREGEKQIREMADTGSGAGDLALV